MKKTFCISIVAAIAVSPLPAQAQGAGIAFHVGTLGVGADIAAAFGSHFGLRSGFNFFPTDIDITVSDIPYQIDFASPTFTFVLDLYLVGPLRLSGGGVFSPDDIVLAGEITGPVDINGTVYSPSQIGTLTGTILTNELSPYAGIGLGNPGRSKFGFFLDLGVAFHGTPGFTLTAVGGSASTLLQFQADLAAEEQSIRDDLANITVYPVVTIGFYIGF
ncbi:MAG: hypothetical protein IIB90_15300 [Gemmatimonadetes bacterium]|nr:hypothetical protein [Gemmatimonadota bacterium]